MAKYKWAKKIASWAIELFGKEVMIIAKGKIKQSFRKYFKSKNILVLGKKQTGKTSLIYLMKNGMPYELGEDGEVEPPNPTAFSAVIDTKVNLEGEGWAKISEDLPGDQDLRETWDEAIEKIKPHGIIYMIDGRKSKDKIEASVREMTDSVLDHYENELKNLRVVHLFVNFADVWSNTPSKDRSKLRFVESKVDEAIGGSLPLQELLIETHKVQLSPHKESWPNAKSSLIKFGADLKSR